MTPCGRGRCGADPRQLGSEKCVGAFRLLVQINTVERSIQVATTIVIANWILGVTEFGIGHSEVGPGGSSAYTCLNHGIRERYIVSLFRTTRYCIDRYISNVNSHGCRRCRHLILSKRVSKRVSKIPYVDRASSSQAGLVRDISVSNSARRG